MRCKYYCLRSFYKPICVSILILEALLSIRCVLHSSNFAGFSLEIVSHLMCWYTRLLTRYYGRFWRWRVKSWISCTFIYQFPPRNHFWGVMLNIFYLYVAGMMPSILKLLIFSIPIFVSQEIHSSSPSFLQGILGCWQLSVTYFLGI